ncbi:CBO0543 family protein [Bacillus solitudinis]|uniref:CBO0543 family protein n=1 Tax=Bacillus solitudinis TaxID=2014074 RepID=UPI000C24764D|nr:CBO0543 family protein [Bacillus solitudinis]
MIEKQTELLNQIRTLEVKVSQFELQYWRSFSDFGTWQFWVVLITVVAPLIVLFLSIDKRKILLLGFFGFNYHVWFHYANTAGIELGLWEYPYQIVPILPSFALDASLVPVCFMLLYQWSLNHKKNIYLYSVLLSAVFAFVLKPIMVNLHFFHMFKGINYIHLFLFYVAFFIVSKLITNLFLWLQKKEK